MAGGRDTSKMKLLGCYVTKDFKQRVIAEANHRGITVADLIRDLLKEEMDENGEIGSQRNEGEKKD
tara:strand:+ start:460 stop:657 length:198 start_codon:yes stop_codon:yes gene_type:complete